MTATNQKAGSMERALAKSSDMEARRDQPDSGAGGVAGVGLTGVMTGVMTGGVTGGVTGVSPGVGGSGIPIGFGIKSKSGTGITIGA